MPWCFCSDILGGCILKKTLKTAVCEGIFSKYCFKFFSNCSIFLIFRQIWEDDIPPCYWHVPLLNKSSTALLFFSLLFITLLFFSRDVPDIRYYPVSGQEFGIRLDPVSCIWYKMISGIIRYPISGRILYPILSGTLPTTAKHRRHRFLWHLIFLVSWMHPKSVSRWH